MFDIVKKEGNMNPSLVEKYNVAIPRYTSYPPVPFWTEKSIDEEAWLDQVVSAYEAEGGLSLYIHLPFCESLCTYCGCNKRITKNHAVEQPYIAALIKEWHIYTQALGGRPKVKQIHLGGGTPTFFSPEHLSYLIATLLDDCDVDADAEMSLEVHPTSTSYEHLSALRDLGFNRISIGVQDISPRILEAINRRQTTQQISQVTQWARELGYDSVNYDIIYGLPFQTKKEIADTVAYLGTERPDRIAFYSYAHVPWKSASQRAYSEENLAKGIEKSALYTYGRMILEDLGYIAVGMDHFCLPDDELYQSYQAGEMHRNFMGYTSRYTKCMIGLGASSIGDSWTAYAQNEKKIEDYQNRVLAGELPLTKGHQLSIDESYFRRTILDLMCRDKTPATQSMKDSKHLHTMLQDDLITYENDDLVVTPTGRSFVRNVCAAIDPLYSPINREQKIFSQAI